MKTLRVVLGDQLTRDSAAFADLDPARDVILMVEVHEETSYVPHHKQKIALVLSAMRHFARALEDEGLIVDYVQLEDPQNTGSFARELLRAAQRHKCARAVVVEPGEYRVLRQLQGAAKTGGIRLEIREDGRFFCSRTRFARWAAGRGQLRMEFFYREMRRETGLLMQGEEPVGGRWNFDAENRKPLPARLEKPPSMRFQPDATTREVLDLVARLFRENFGDLETFRWGVTRAEALAALDVFITHRLPLFGDYQDAMRTGEPHLYHSVVSPYLNLGLLKAREVCDAAEGAFRRGLAPLNAVEGFIRQILGWREFMRGVYWLNMPQYAQGNAFGAERSLPGFFWTGATKMNCVAEVIDATRRNAYAHHIQRLMVTGNFALLAGLAPREVEAWYLAVYADAYEWVELPNTHGMALFADGGVVASKPYAASGAYINRMSDYCRKCTFNPKLKAGPKACPLNFLYWDFFVRNRDRLKGNPRLQMTYRTLDAMDDTLLLDVKESARDFLAELDKSRGHAWHASRVESGRILEARTGSTGGVSAEEQTSDDDARERTSQSWVPGGKPPRADLALVVNKQAAKAEGEKQQTARTTQSCGRKGEQ